MSRKKIAGAEAFENYYTDLFGSRWIKLRDALLQPVQHLSWNVDLEKTYFLDPGSVIAALCLPLKGAQNILDMCAAPGGKSLVLAGQMDRDAHLTANELSRDRRRRLTQVLESYLPESFFHQISITGYDAARWSRYEKSAYDRILLDAPCSSERHVLSAPQYLDEWTFSRIRNLAQRQWALLSGAWLVLKSEGYLLYSTCALSPHENDNIIAKLKKKYNDVSIIDPVLTAHHEMFSFMGERTIYGYHILPDTASGAGPLYYSLLKKN